jgi:hypothetical protein
MQQIYFIFSNKSIKVLFYLNILQEFNVVVVKLIVLEL